MRPLTENLLSSVRGAVGKEILKELWNAPWNSSQSRTINEISVAIGGSVGNVRSNNEDRLAVAHVTALNQEQFAVAIVCDGVGGSERGDEAATIAIAVFIDELAQVRQFLPLSELLESIIRRVDEVVRKALNGEGTTTLSVMLASSTGKFVAANVGDSRIFAWTPSESYLQQISIDDTIENELIKFSGIDPSVLDARGLRGRLSQAIGEGGRTPSDLKVVISNKEAFNSKGIILATDGTWKSSEEGFRQIAIHSESATDAMRRVLAFSSWTGGVDNASIIAIEDISKFSSSLQSPLNSSSTASRTTIWFCDGKFSVSVQVVDFQSVNQGATVEAKSPAKIEKSKNKTPTRRKASSTSSRKKDAGQMKLIGEAHAHHAVVNVRPVVKISTDDNDDSIGGGDADAS